MQLTPREKDKLLVAEIFLTPETVFNLFSSGLATNLEPSDGEAPSRKTDTLTKGS